jgi:integrase
MLLTGWRRGKILGLLWSDIDLDRRTARLTDTKTGFSMLALPPVAFTVLRTLDQTGDLVFPNEVGEIMVGYRKSWLKIATFGNVPGDITPHMLRHSFASLAGDLAYSEATIATLIGHKGHSITSRYVHSADAVLLAAADAVADATKKLLGLGIAPHGNPPIFDATSSNSVATTRTHPKPSHEGPTFISI